MAGHVMNFFRAVRHAKRLIAQGEIGEVLYCHWPATAGATAALGELESPGRKAAAIYTTISTSWTASSLF